MRVFRERLSNFVCILSVPFGIQGGTWDVIVLIPGHYLSIYYALWKRFYINWREIHVEQHHQPLNTVGYDPAGKHERETGLVG